MKHAHEFTAVNIDIAYLFINVISERDGYAFKRCAEAYAKNGHILTGLDSYEVSTLKMYEKVYGLPKLVEALELYATWYDENGTEEGADDDGHTAEGTV